MEKETNKKHKSWLIQITILCFLLGVLISLTLKTQIQATKEGLPGRMSDSGEVIKYFSIQAKELESHLEEQKAINEKLVKQQSKGIATSAPLINLLNKTKKLAGTCDLHGPGLILTLTDSPKASDPTTQGPIDHLLVHAEDILIIVNELNNAGAEAVSVNDKRITSRTSIRCAGTQILINQDIVAVPFVINAIGNPDDLYAGVNLPGNRVSDLNILGMITLKKSEDITVKAYNKDTFKYEYAQEVKPDEEK
ncbi:MAG: DUF881 domain-containing protein [Armatimonadetes bacterium]|nr:DUF881 domain-containing protein [Candidatus Hippobium faecium]